MTTQKVIVQDSSMVHDKNQPSLLPLYFQTQSKTNKDKCKVIDKGKTLTENKGLNSVSGNYEEHDSKWETSQ